MRKVFFNTRLTPVALHDFAPIAATAALMNINAQVILTTFELTAVLPVKAIIPIITKIIKTIAADIAVEILMILNPRYSYLGASGILPAIFSKAYTIAAHGINEIAIMPITLVEL